ncbi:MAG: WD40 repeat domain-containing protein [Clostridia bacterium]|nr:WD40 repeat domain-containing protein [Clostridia bacterium]
MGLFNLFKGNAKADTAVVPDIPGLSDIGIVESGYCPIMDADGERVFTLMGEGTFSNGFIRIHPFNDLGKFKEILVFTRDEDYLIANDCQMALSRNGSYLAIGSKLTSLPGKARYFIYGGVVDIQESKITRLKEAATYSPGMHGTERLTFSPDSSMIALSGSDDRITLADVSSIVDPESKAYKTVSTLSTSVCRKSQALCWSPDGGTIADYKLISSDKQRFLYLWSISRKSEGAVTTAFAKELFFKAYGDIPMLSRTEVEMCFSGDSCLLAIGGDKNSDTLKIVDIKQQCVAFESERLGSPVKTLAFSPDGKTLVTGSADGCLRAWRIGNENGGFRVELVQAVKLPGEICRLGYSEKGSDLLMIYRLDKKHYRVCRLSGYPARSLT